jgi:hypothetical protein
MSLTWSLFHLIWWIGCFAIVLFALQGQRHKAVWLLPALLLVTAWYVKNAVLYDTFAASTWGGLNLFKIVTHDIPGETRKGWIKEGKISPLALVPPFRSPEVYPRYFPRCWMNTTPPAAFATNITASTSRLVRFTIDVLWLLVLAFCTVNPASLSTLQTGRFFPFHRDASTSLASDKQYTERPPRFGARPFVRARRGWPPTG